MKKLFMVALLAVTVATSAFAKDTKKVNTATLRNFSTEFTHASNITWTSAQNFVKATFILDDQKMEAFYNESGEKIATSRTISIEELPVVAKRAVAKKLNGYTVKESIELDGQEGSAYYISAENEKETVILKVNREDGVSTFKTTKK